MYAQLFAGYIFVPSKTEAEREKSGKKRKTEKKEDVGSHFSAEMKLVFWEFTHTLHYNRLSVVELISPMTPPLHTHTLT